MKVESWGRRLRGLAGLSTVGGFISGIVGAVSMIGLGINNFGFSLDPVVWRMILEGSVMAGTTFFVAGAVTTAGFASWLAATSGRRSLQELPLWQMSLMGAVVAALIPAGLLVSSGGFGSLWAVGTRILPLTAVFAACGGLLSSTLVGIAKRADRKELGQRTGGLLADDS